MDWSSITGPGHIRKYVSQEPEMHGLPGLNDHSQQSTIKKAMMLRKWAMSMANYCGREYLLPGFGRLDIIEQARALANYQCGLWCGDAAAWYVNVLRCFYVPAARFFYGYNRTGGGGLSHVTVLVGYNTSAPGEPYDFEFAIIDPYLGFHYQDAQGDLMPIHDLIPRVIQEEYETIYRVDTALERPYLASPDEKHGFRRWLFPNNQQPAQGELHGSGMVFQGASHSVDKLFTPGSPTWKQAEERRGNMPMEHYLLKLMLTHPRFEQIMPRLASEPVRPGDEYSHYQFQNKMTCALATTAWPDWGAAIPGFGGIRS
jgi:hypothetical protein